MVNMGLCNSSPFFKIDVLYMKNWMLAFGMLLVTAALQAQTINLSAAAVEQRIREKDVVVLDVRTAEEFRNGHLPNAQLIDVLQPQQFTQAVKQLSRNKTYVVYCHSGRRSLDAARLMEELGFRSVINMKEGILGWKGSISKK